MTPTPNITSQEALSPVGEGSAVGHTPGPWRVAAIHASGLYLNDGSAAVSRADGEGRIGTVDCQANFKRGEGYRAQCAERDANARLIAAAPELLEALKATTAAISAAIRMQLAEHQGHERTADRLDKEIQAARSLSRAAIAKAEGAAQ